jgi:serine/threonine-protein kinase
MVRAMADHAECCRHWAERRRREREIEQAHQLAVAQLGLQHPITADVEHIQGRCSRKRATMPARSTGSKLRGDARAALAQPTCARRRSNCRSRANARATTTSARSAHGTPGERKRGRGSEPRNLRWRARAYSAKRAAAARTRLRARSELDALSNELHTALPQGGRLPREVDAIRAACTPLALQVTRRAAQSSSDG